MPKEFRKTVVTTVRKCLRCRNNFDSVGIGNRLCPRCRDFAANSQGLRPATFPEASGTRPGKTHARSRPALGHGLASGDVRFKPSAFSHGLDPYATFGTV